MSKMGSWPMSLDNLVGRGLQRELSDGDEVRRYLRRVANRLADARSDAISLESRFDLAYEALLQTGLVALRAHGYRVDSPESLKPVLEKAIDNDRPAVIDVTIERGSETSPWKYIHG